MKCKIPRPTVHESSVKNQTCFTVCVKHRIIDKGEPVFWPTNMDKHRTDPFEVLKMKHFKELLKNHICLNLFFFFFFKRDSKSVNPHLSYTHTTGWLKDSWEEM